MHQIYTLFKETIAEFRKHNISQMAASLAYFGLFATAPIILITITLLNFFLSDLQIRYTLVNEVRSLAGPQVSSTVQTVLQNMAKNKGEHTIFEIVTVALLVVAATTLFIQLQKILNELWDIKLNKPITFLKSIQTRFFSLIGIMVAGFAFYIFFVLSIAFNLLGSYIKTLTGYDSGMLQSINFVISFFFIIAVVTNIFKYIPNARISWKDAIVGGTITASLLTMSRYFLTFYFSKSVVGSVYGTAGSLMVFLAWIYFSALIFLFGVIFTRIHAEHIGDGIHPHKL
ncbi:YihY/virulence factor BrkB family protein [soil metagenome]